MFGLNIGRLGALASSVARAWSPLALWPTGTEPGMWIDPSNLTSQWQDSAGTTQVSTPGTVADSSNPVGLALDLRLGATVLTDPGNHLLQATSTARPLESARVNALKYTEDFGNVYWAGKQNLTVVSDAISPPTGFTNVDKLVGTATVGTHRLLQTSVSGTNTLSFFAHGAELRRCALLIGAPFAGAWFDTTSGTCGVLTDHPDTITQSIESIGDGFYRCSVTVGGISGQDQGVQFALLPDGSTSYAETSVALDGLGLYVTGAQLNHGPAAPYQSVPGDGSTYPSTGFPIFQKYDGTDDGMATATFAAGTLSNAMDCMIAVRRDSTVLPSICGLYQVDQTRYFGVVGEEPSRSEPTFGNCGSPTIFVDGVSVANTRGALHSAIGVGDWHILEYRDLDLSAWVSAGFGSYGSPYMLNGAQGGILLFPSSTSTADRDAARTWLGAKVGLTL